MEEIKKDLENKSSSKIMKSHSFSIKQNIWDIPDHLNYLGFYFRDAYRNALASILLANKEKVGFFDSHNPIYKLYENETESVTPEINESLRDLHFKHTKQSIQRLNCFNVDDLHEDYTTK